MAKKVGFELNSTRKGAEVFEVESDHNQDCPLTEIYLETVEPVDADVRRFMGAVSRKFYEASPANPLYILR